MHLICCTVKVDSCQARYPLRNSKGVGAMTELPHWIGYQPYPAQCKIMPVPCDHSIATQRNPVHLLCRRALCPGGRSGAGGLRGHIRTPGNPSGLMGLSKQILRSLGTSHGRGPATSEAAGYAERAHRLRLADGLSRLCRFNGHHDDSVRRIQYFNKIELAFWVTLCCGKAPRDGQGVTGFVSQTGPLVITCPRPEQ